MLEDYECYLYTETKSKLSCSTIKLKIKEIRNLVYEVLKDEVFQYHDMDSFIKDEIETKGIVIIDEIDKLVSNQNSSNISEASVSAEGVQYDLLPLLDGTSIEVGKGLKINTRNILFVGVGAFERTKTTDLTIEL